MRKYHKGRVLVLSGMLAFSSATVLAGTAAAESGKLKVTYGGNMPATLTHRQAKELKKHNTFYGACLDLTSLGFSKKSKHLGDDPQATFELKGGGYNQYDGQKVNGKMRKTSDISPTWISQSDDFNGTAEYDLSDWLDGFSRKNGKIDKKGYHVRITYGDRHITVWVQNAIGCDGTSHGGDPDPVVLPDCKPNHIVGRIEPTAIGNVYGAGETVGVKWDGLAVLDETSITATVTNTTTGADVPVDATPVVTPNADGSSNITVVLPADTPKYGNITFGADEVDNSTTSTKNNVECGYDTWDFYAPGSNL